VRCPNSRRQSGANRPDGEEDPVQPRPHPRLQFPKAGRSERRDETIAMTVEILRVESEIDARVQALYGL